MCAGALERMKDVVKCRLHVWRDLAAGRRRQDANTCPREVFNVSICGSGTCLRILTAVREIWGRHDVEHQSSISDVTRYRPYGRQCSVDARRISRYPTKSRLMPDGPGKRSRNPN